MRRGQVAIYLALVLVVITLLVLMNVSVFLGVSAKNATMNAGDAAAIAVADLQRDLLNRIGRLNVDHLKAAIKGDSDECEQCVREQLRLSFLGPLEGIEKGNEAAVKAARDLEPMNDLADFLKSHAVEVRTIYAANTDSYPEPWEGAWEDFAIALELAVSKNLVVGPDNIDFVNPAAGHFLLNRDFYAAIAGHNWCWFKFYAPGLLDNYTGFRDWAPLPTSDLETRSRKCVNCEIYSLGLELKTGSAMQLLGKEVIARLTKRSEAELENCPLLTDRNQRWFFFDPSVWREWTEMNPYNADGLPIVGQVKREYDLRGAAAICRVRKNFVNLVEEGLSSTSVWSGAAKPFGVVNLDKGVVEQVAFYGGLVTDAFFTSKLVPLDSVGGRDLATADVDWMIHVSKHLPKYVESGPSHRGNCFYCKQLVTWERSSFRSGARRWLKISGGDCYRAEGPSGGSTGGTSHGH